ncbi:MAG: FliH/SctL family protein [Bryobacteraceae bacterium]
MSSRIIGTESPSVERFAWRRLHPEAEVEAEELPREEPELFVPEPIPDPVPGLEAEIARLRREIDRVKESIPPLEEQARSEGYQIGFREGEGAGSQRARQEASRECEQIMLKATSSIEEWVHFRVRIRQQLEHDLVRLATSIARRIVRRELTVDPDTLMGIVKAAVAKIDVREIHRLVVSTQDAPLVQQRVAELSLPLRVEVAADSALPRGSLILETTRGQLDASVETQLEEIDRGLADLVRRSA